MIDCHQPRERCEHGHWARCERLANVWTMWTMSLSFQLCSWWLFATVCCCNAVCLWLIQLRFCTSHIMKLQLFFALMVLLHPKHDHKEQNKQARYLLLVWALYCEPIVPLLMSSQPLLLPPLSVQLYHQITTLVLSLFVSQISQLPRKQQECQYEQWVS